MKRVVDGIKWLLTALWIAGFSILIAVLILFAGVATIGHTLLSFFRRW